MDSWNRERRKKHPSRGKAMDYENSRSIAIEEYCRECMQTSRSCTDCPAPECPLWPYRPGATEGEPRPGVPSREQYDSWIKEQDPDGLRAAAIRERFGRGKGDGEEGTEENGNLKPEEDWE